MDFEHQPDCLNCGNILTAEFCGHCGQEKVQRITFKNLLVLIQRGTLELRSPLLQTIIGLTLRPADTCRAYLAGKRINYFNPAKYAFWLTTFTILFASYLNVSLVEASLQSFTSEDLASDGFSTFKAILENGLVYFFFVSAFLMAIASRLVFRKKQYNIFEFYVIYLMLNGHLAFVSIALIGFGLYDNMQSQIGLILISILYPTIVIARIFTERRIGTYIKSFAANILGFSFASIIFGFVGGFIAGALGL